METLTKEELLKKYDLVGDFYEGLATAEKNKEQFHIKPDGAPAYPERYKFVGDFNKGLARVIQNGKEFYINQNGDIIDKGKKMTSKEILRTNFIISTIVFFILLIVLVLLSSLKVSKANAIICLVVVIVSEILIMIQAYLSRNGHEKLIK